MYKYLGTEVAADKCNKRKTIWHEIMGEKHSSKWRFWAVCSLNE